ncbi:MAG: hypothetical protein KGL35_06625 [Bradyrhizobium sp.]|uniref:hypothetical protein n=1 Tax=Bradyrhizobium sp. TaxID=376 RepID=UPI001C29AFFA|nr:hypothetical protein [Bradyrhizobium sp.]MBU6465043.1 hypothetical protein [Pseudomonadota bacterium]MDE2067422.1 hypothetical protein [Bradyrhizobium sp.]MDE2468411.1 hypothetical protein [Bradyrhizobium sp.]
MTEQGALEAAGADTAGADAVVLGACVEVLGCSPGNCTGISGSTDDDVRAPTADPVDDTPAGPGESEADAFDVGTFDVGTFKGSDAQADPATAPPIDVPDGEQPILLRLWPPKTG